MPPAKFHRSIRRVQRTASPAQPFFQPAPGNEERSAGLGGFFAPAPVVQHSSLTPGTGAVQRKCMECEQEEKEQVQRKENASTKTTGGAAPPIVSNVLSSGGGQSMDAGTRQFMENRFGQDFGQVRIHTDSRAAESAAAIQARAYTSGRDVVFGKGEYQPAQEDGKRLLAHELAHVGQQSKGSEVESGGNNLMRQTEAQETLPAWNSRELRAIQTELRRLGFYPRRRAGRSLTIDGIFGEGTRSGLVEAFGGEEWKTLDPPTIISRLRNAATPTRTRGEHDLRYGEMFRDGVLDITLGIGYDETGANLAQIASVESALLARNFREANTDLLRALAATIYAQAGRSFDPAGFGRIFMRPNALTYTPPAGAPRQIHAIVKLVTSPTGAEGGAAAGAFQEGMIQSDSTFYGGHGRYGSGPDFDRNMSFELLDASGTLTQTIDDYEVLEQVLRDEGRRSGRSAWQQFLWRQRNGRINVIGSNAGNVFLNPQNRHSGEFGANLMYWNLQRQGGQGATPVTGRGGALSRDAAANPDRRYRLLVFDGCRTQDYERSIRNTPGLDTASTDLMTSTRSLYWSDIGDTLAAYIDSLIAQNSAERIIKNMDDVNTTNNASGRTSFHGNGFEDNPS